MISEKFAPKPGVAENDPVTPLSESADSLLNSKGGQLAAFAVSEGEDILKQLSQQDQRFQLFAMTTLGMPEVVSILAFSQNMDCRTGGKDVEP